MAAEKQPIAKLDKETNLSFCINMYSFTAASMNAQIYSSLDMVHFAFHFVSGEPLRFQTPSPTYMGFKPQSENLIEKIDEDWYERKQLNGAGYRLGCILFGSHELRYINP